MGYSSLFGGYKEEEEAWKDGQGCLISIIGEPCPIFPAAPGGVSGQPGNNGSYAPATQHNHC